jgi:hyperosmotically inducible protein
MAIVPKARMHTNRRAIVLLCLVLLAPLALVACGKSVSETIDDASITTRVKTALLNDLELGVRRIDVDTFKGVVMLSGVVDTAAERDKAVEIARKVEGVRDVKSTLEVRQQGRDSRIRSSIFPA